MKTKFYNELCLIGKGISYIHRLAPGNLLIKFIKSTAEAALPFVDMYFSAKIIDTLLAGERVSTALLQAGLLVGLSLFLRLAASLLEVRNYEMFNRLFRKYNMMVSNKIMQLDYCRIEDPQTHQRLRNVENAMKISNYGLIKLHSRIPLLYQNLFSTVLAFVFIGDVLFAKGTHGGAIASGWMTAMLLGVIVISVVVSVVGNGRVAAKTYALLGKFSGFNAIYDYYLNHYLVGHRAGKDIRLYRQDRLILQELQEVHQNSGKTVSEIHMTECRYAAVSSVSALVLNILAFLYVGAKALTGAVSIGNVFKFSGSVAQLGLSICAAIDAGAQLRANIPYLQDFLCLMEEKNNMYQGSLTVEKRDDNEYNVEFRNVSFRYPNTEAYALRNVNLKFRIGEKLAIVGMNGSGKTTFIKLLCRLYDPTEGEILLNGVDIRKYDYDEYMSVFSVVFQDFRLFAFTLGQNVAAGITYDRERVEDCLIRAGFGERLAAMPAGVDTYLYKDFDKGGVEISGGEAQKIALARALYKDAPFILLDEPTAALDPVSEYEVYSNFNRISGDKTTVYISHRLASCRFCDKIAVFDRGSIVQTGKHEELLADADGKYHELWHAQAQYYEK